METRRFISVAVIATWLVMTVCAGGGFMTSAMDHGSHHSHHQQQQQSAGQMECCAIISSGVTLPQAFNAFTFFTATIMVVVFFMSFPPLRAERIYHPPTR